MTSTTLSTDTTLLPHIQVDRLDSVSVVKNEIAEFISLKEGKRISACNILIFELSSTCENITR